MGPLHPRHQKSQVWFQQPVGKSSPGGSHACWSLSHGDGRISLTDPTSTQIKHWGEPDSFPGGWEGGREGNAITREIWLKAAVSSGAAESRASSLLPQGSQPGHKGWKKWVGRDSRISGSCALRKCTHTHTPRRALSAPEIPLDGMTVAYSFCSSFHSERLSSRRCWGTEDPRLKEKKEASENREDLPLSTPLRLHPDLLPLSPEAGWRGVPERAREGADTGPHAGKQHA